MEAQADFVRHWDIICARYDFGNSSFRVERYNLDI